MKSDWRKPFLKFKAELKSLYDVNLSIYHAVLMSTNRTRQELLPVIERLEPAYRRKVLAESIEVDTDGCTYHGHLFFADDRRGLNQLGRLLDGIEEWTDKIPGGFIPSFEIPHGRNQSHRNILRWISIVYYLAWASDAVYLDAELEYQTSVDRIGFFPWTECPQPTGCLPLHWLIHQGVSTGRLPMWKKRFEDYRERIPDVIDAYLTGELVMSSLAAIDILVFVLNGERRQEALDREDYGRKLKTEQSKTKKVTREVQMLKSFLAGWHTPARTKLLDEPEDPFKPLTAFEIAEKLGWITPEGNFAQSKVSHRMRAIYGPDPMKVYRESLTSSDRDRYSERLRDGTHAGERFVESETDDLDLD